MVRSSSYLLSFTAVAFAIGLYKVVISNPYVPAQVADSTVYGSYDIMFLNDRVCARPSSSGAAEYKYRCQGADSCDNNKLGSNAADLTTCVVLYGNGDLNHTKNGDVVTFHVLGHNVVATQAAADVYDNSVNAFYEMNEGLFIMRYIFVLVFAGIAIAAQFTDLKSDRTLRARQSLYILGYIAVCLFVVFLSRIAHDAWSLDFYTWLLVIVQLVWVFLLRSTDMLTSGARKIPDLVMHTSFAAVLLTHAICLLVLNHGHSDHYGNGAMIWIGVAILLSSLWQLLDAYYVIVSKDGASDRNVPVIGNIKFGQLQPTQLHERASMLKNSLNLDC